MTLTIGLRKLDGSTPNPGPQVVPRLLRLETRQLDHLGPLRKVGCDQRPELARRQDDRRGAELGELRLDARVCQPGIDLAVELLDDVGWRAAGNTDAGPRPHLISGNCFP